MKVFLLSALLIMISFASWGAGSDESEVVTYPVKISTNLGPLNIEIHGMRKSMAYMQRVAAILIGGAPRIVRFLNYVPTSTIHIVIKENSVTANGSATVFPYGIIHLNPIPPTGDGHMASTGDWNEGLVLHELVHILHLDQTTGLLGFAGNIFGSISKVFTGIVPRWFTEGAATWMESTFTKGGRLKNSLLKFELETLFLNPEFCSTIDCLDEPGVYPYGSHSYWIGAYFLGYVEKRKPKSIPCIMTKSSSLPMQFFSAFYECTGISVADAFKKFRQEKVESIKRNQRKVSKIIKSKNFINLKLKDEWSETWQQGILLGAEKTFKVEVNKDGLQRIAAYGKNGGLLEHFRVDDRIEALHSQTHYLKKMNRILISTLDIKAGNPLHPSIKKNWGIYNLVNFTKLQELSFDKKAFYVFPIAKDSFYYLTYDFGRWELIKSVSEKEKVIYRFPYSMNVFSPEIKHGRFSFKSYQASEKNSDFKLLSLSIKSKNIREIYRSTNSFQSLGTCSKNHLIIDGNQLIIGSLGKNKTLIRRMENVWPTKTAYLKWGENRALVLFKDYPGKSYLYSKGCGELIRKVKSIEATGKDAVSLELDSIKPEVSDDQLESYPSFSHLLPRYWFFNYTSGNTLSYLSLFTSGNDPRGKHQYNLNFDWYTGESKFAGGGSYSYQLGRFSIGPSYSKSFSKSSFSTTIDAAESSSFGISTGFSFFGLAYRPQVYYGLGKTRDFISKRTTTTVGLNQTFSSSSIVKDQFFQKFYLNLDVYKNDVEDRISYNAFEAKSNVKFSFNAKAFLLLQGTYGKFDKTDFSSGVLFGGGDNSYGSSSYHEFYGIDYSNIFGNEIYSARGQLILPIFDIYRGLESLPVFLKEMHLLGGMDFISAERILVGNSVLFNNSVKSIHGGLRTKTTLFYYAPVDIDIIYAYVMNPLGNDESSILFLLKGIAF